MTTPTVDDVLRDLAKRGELNHISLASGQGGKTFRASFAMSSKFGVSYAEDADPVKAIIIACTTAKMKPRKEGKVDGRLKENVDSIPQPIVDVKTAEQEADELM